MSPLTKHSVASKPLVVPSPVLTLPLPLHSNPPASPPDEQHRAGGGGGPGPGGGGAAVHGQPGLAGGAVHLLHGAAHPQRQGLRGEGAGERLMSSPNPAGSIYWIV